MACAPEHRYYPSLDGLRAVAAVPVVLLRAGATWLPGGFIGVDVFFVLPDLISFAKSLLATLGFYSNAHGIEANRLLQPLIGSAMERLLWRAYINAGRAAQQ